MQNLNELALEIIDGKRLCKNDDLAFFENCELSELTFCADKIRKHFIGDNIDLCTIINGKSGRCSENCKFCAQSVHNKTCCKEYSFLDFQKIFEAAQENQNEGVNRFAIVTAGKSLCGADFDKAISVFEKLHSELKINLCASMGFLSQEQFRALKKAGVSRYHCNIETSENYFSKICTSHTFEMKIQNIKMAQSEGLFVCSGGIIGMGESFEDRIDMALTLSELNIRSIPINALMAIKGSPLENVLPLTEAEILRTLAMFRFINPQADIRLAAGRKLLSENGRRAFESGASSAITGNMLTTTGSTIALDKQMFSKMNRTTVADYL